MSHELRTPMNTIDGMTKLLLKILQDKNYTDNNNLYKYAECIHNSSKTMINLISDLIDTSAIEEERVEIRLECNDITRDTRMCKKHEIFCKGKKYRHKFHIKKYTKIIL